MLIASSLTDLAIACLGAEVPIEAVVEDENLLALEEGAGEEGTPLDSLDPDETGTAGTSKPKKATRGGKKAPKLASGGATKENVPPPQVLRPCWAPAYSSLLLTCCCSFPYGDASHSMMLDLLSIAHLLTAAQGFACSTTT